MEVIDLCIVATHRPEILKRTLGSFLKYVKFDGVINVNINIDYVPEIRQSSPDTVVGQLTMDSVIRDFMRLSAPHYTNRTITNANGDFAKAVKTLWKITEADYVFHLEDDWEFIRDIDLNECVAMMKNDGINYIRFPKLHAAHLGILHKVALQPSFWSGSFVRDLSKVLDVTKDPEKQLRVLLGNDKIDNILIKYTKPKVVDIKISDGHCSDSKGIVDYGKQVYCKDIGREWRENNNIKKEGGKWIYE